MHGTWCFFFFFFQLGAIDGVRLLLRLGDTPFGCVRIGALAFRAFRVHTTAFTATLHSSPGRNDDVPFRSFSFHVLFYLSSIMPSNLSPSFYFLLQHFRLLHEEEKEEKGRKRRRKMDAVTYGVSFAE